MHQLEIVSLDQLVSSDHNYRKFIKLWDLKPIYKELLKIKKEGPHEGYSIDRLFMCLLVQFMEDLSDRELERFLKESTAAKWFCGFSLTEDTPNYSVFSRARSRVGTHLLSKIFEELRMQLKAKGYMSEVFTFVDGAHLIAKANLWEEIDKAIAAKYEKLNNEVLPKVAKDKQARIGGKGKNKYWYGYKKLVSVDMQSGLINKVAVTPANVTGARGVIFLFMYVLKAVLCMLIRATCVKPAVYAAKIKGIYLAAIKKNNMKGKNFDLTYILRQLDPLALSPTGFGLSHV